MIPACQRHGRLMLDLALGELREEKVLAAESIQASCLTCHDWWIAHLDGDLAREIDQVVEESFAAFHPPSQKRSTGWLPLAAAAALALGVGLVLRVADQGGSDAPALETAGTEIVQEFFESDIDEDGEFELANLFLVTGGDSSSGRQPFAITSPGQDRQVIFRGDLESGDLTIWSPEI